jgi:hypothetical protein
MILAPALTLSAGSGAAIVRPTFSRDFAGEKTLNNGTGPAITFTRGTNATFFDANGTLRFAPHNAIRNSQAGGSTNGVIGVTGIAPTNWQTSVPTGITREIIGTGTLNGFSYIDIKFSGTNTSGSSSSFLVGFDTTTQIVAANGQTWTGSVYIALVGGSFSGATGPAVDLVERSVGGSYLTGTQTNISAATSTLARFSATRTFNQATTERTTVQVAATVPSGNTVDLTLRIAAPQLERNATASEYIPTAGTANFDQPRFDHSGGSSLGLLIEEARTNLLERSAEFDNAYWTKLRSSVTANSATAPDSTNTAEKLVEDGQNNSHTLYRFVTHAGANAAVTWSVFCKAAERTHVDLAVQGDQSGTKSGGRAVFNLSAGTVGSFTAINSGTGSASITNVGNGWYRCSLTVTPVGITATLSEAYVTPTDGTSIFYQGNGVNGIYIWGAQLEAGAFPTSYIPTTAAAATRSADSAVVTPISGFYNQAEGTLFAEGLAVSGQVALGFDDGSTNNRIVTFMRTQNTSAEPSLVVASASQQSAFNNFSFGATAARLALAYRANDLATTINGLSVSTDSVATLPTVTTARIGSNSVPAFLNGHIRKIAYWPKRLSNTLLQQLTT